MTDLARGIERVVCDDRIGAEEKLDAIHALVAGADHAEDREPFLAKVEEYRGLASKLPPEALAAMLAYVAGLLDGEDWAVTGRLPSGWSIADDREPATPAPESDHG